MEMRFLTHRLGAREKQRDMANSMENHSLTHHLSPGRRNDKPRETDFNYDGLSLVDCWSSISAGDESKRAN